jgi:hypothetical protein
MAELPIELTLVGYIMRIEKSLSKILERLDEIESKIEPTAIEEVYEGKASLGEERYLHLEFEGNPVKASWVHPNGEVEEAVIPSMNARVNKLHPDLLNEIEWIAARALTPDEIATLEGLLAR